MNLGLHGLFLQVIVSIVQFQHGFRLCSAGEPGYLDFDNLPETNFSCQGKVIGGYYADVEAGCQMFHVCTIGQKDEIMDIKFLCLNGTVFDQETRVCERVDEVDCSKSEKFYNLNLELYGNHAVTLSLHESVTDEEDEPSELIDDHESQRTTSARPSTTSSTTTTTPRPIISSTTSASGSYQHPSGYPQHYQPQPRFPSVQTSQSKSLYDDKNGGYHHQYIYHTGDHRTNNLDNNNDGSNNNNNNNENHNDNNNNQATSYQLFSNQGVSSTTGAPQIHQIRYSSTPATQIQIHNDHQPTVPPIFHATSSTIQTLLNSNANSPALINPIFHNHGIASTTEQFNVHNNNPRETDEYRDNDQGDHRDVSHEDRRSLEAIQPTTQGKVSKLTISPVPTQEDSDRSNQQGKNGQQQQRITTSFLPTPSNDDGQAIRSFYPTPRTSTKSSSSHVTHIHLPPPPSIPQLKPHQITINLPSPDIQRIVQNPSPLLPSQSRVIVTAKASVSDESGRALNTTQLVTIPLPTIPASYDDYKEGDESFDPFYRDVPKIRNDRRAGGRFRWPVRDSREKRSERTRRDVENEDKIEDIKVIERSEVSRENSTKEMAKVGIEKIDDIEDKKMVTKNEEEKDMGDIEDKELETGNMQEKNMDDIKDKGSETENEEETNMDVVEDKESETENEEEANMDDIEDKRSVTENEKEKNMDDIKAKRLETKNEQEKNMDDIEDKELEIENEQRQDLDDIEVKRSEMANEQRKDLDDSEDKSFKIENEQRKHIDDIDDKTSEIENEQRKDIADIDDKTSEIENEQRKDVADIDDKTSEIENEQQKDIDDLKTMSSRHHSDSEEKIDEKSAIGTKESDEEEYVDEVKTKSVIDSRETDAEEYVNASEEAFDSKIFDEPESQTSKEVDIRAVAQQDSKYSKDRNDRFEKEEKNSKHEHSNGLGTAKRGPEEESSRFSLLPEIVSPRKSQRKHSTKKLKLKEQVAAEEEEEEKEKEAEEDEDEEQIEEEEVVNPRKSHQKHSAKKLKLIERLPAKEEEEEEGQKRDMSSEKLDEERETSPEKLDDERQNSRETLDEERQMSRETLNDEREMSREENSPDNYDYYDTEMDPSSVTSIEEDSSEYSKESPNKINPSSRQHKSSHHDKSSSNEESHEKSSNRRDKSKQFREEIEKEHDYDFADVSTTQSNEEVTSIEMSGEYVDSSRINKSPEDSDEVQDNKEEMLQDDITHDSSSELSEEVPSSTEKIEMPEDANTHEDKNSHPDDKHMSEGVLKFTDEIPSSERTDEPDQVENSKSVEETPQDYIDDNYEPQSYKEHEESSSTTEAAITEKIVEKEISTFSTEYEKNVEEISTTETSSMTVTEKEEMEGKQNDEAQLEDLPEVDAKIEKSIEKPIEHEDITSSTSTTTTTTSTTTTSTTTTTTTTAKPTTTARPTPPKLFKPFTLRKSYVYTPPTTTPVPVIIKPRLALLNPKPAKPPKSYNDLAPKPIIRKSPLFARKTTVRTTTPRIEVEHREISTERPIGTTDASMLEEITSSTSTTPLPTTEAPQSSSQATTNFPSPKEVEHSSSNEDHVFISTTGRFEVLPAIETQTFTPYPLLLKMTEATAAMEEDLAQANEPAKEDISTTDRADMENNNVPSVSEPEISTTTTAEAAITLIPEEVFSEKPLASSTEEPQISETPATEATSASAILQNNVVTQKPELEILFSTTIGAVASEIVTENPEVTTTLKEMTINNTPTLASIRAVNRRPGVIKRTTFFNCLEKEMYRFYADGRDCRLFHYCSPGFTSRQVLDFRFVCEEGTTFDEESQSCIHDVKSPKCRKRIW